MDEFDRWAEKLKGKDKPDLNEAYKVAHSMAERVTDLMNQVPDPDSFKQDEKELISTVALLVEAMYEGWDTKSSRDMREKLWPGQEITKPAFTGALFLSVYAEGLRRGGERAKRDK